MDLNTYFQYALVTGLVAFGVIVLSLAVKSWFDESTFTSNLLLTRQFAKMDYDQLMNGEPLTFDEHVESTPGMTHRWN